MKKILMTMLLAALVVTPTALADTKDDALNAAQALAGETATLRESDMDDGVYEFEFRDDTNNTRIDISADGQTGSILKMETEYVGVQRAGQAALDETQAKEAAQAILSETAAVDYALLETDDGSYEWKLFYSDNGDLGLLTLQAGTGEVLSQEVYYAPDALTASDAVAALESAKGAVQIQELDMDLNDALALNYDGKATLDGTVYEFELRGQDGQVMEWERD